MSTKRKSVNVILNKQVQGGFAQLLIIEYQDGRTTYGVSLPRGLTKFGTDKWTAERYWSKAK